MINLEEKNFSDVILEFQQPNDFVVGVNSPLVRVVLVKDRIWRPFMNADGEVQNWGKFETMSCVTYSALNILEGIYFRHTGIRIDFSDRFIASLSGTTKFGNSLGRVADAIRHFGLVMEALYRNQDADTFEQYMQRVTDGKLLAAGLDFLEDWIIYYEWILPRVSDMWEALQESPLQVVVRYAAGDGILDPAGTLNHAVAIVGGVWGEYWLIYDSYSQTYKKYAWNYAFGACLKYSLVKKINMADLNKIPDYTPVQLAEGVGGLGMVNSIDDGKGGKKKVLMVDDPAKIACVVLTHHFGRGLKQVEWDNFTKVDLSGRPLQNKTLAQ